MVGKKQSDLEVRVIKESGERGIKTSYRLVLTDPSALEFTWFEREDNKEKIVKKQEAEALWKEYNPKLKEGIDTLRGFSDKGGLMLGEIEEVLELKTQARGLIDITAKEYNLQKPDRGTRGRWAPIPLNFVAYTFSYYMPILEGWRTSYDVAKDNDVSTSTINNMCQNQEIEARITLKKWHISPIGEQVAVEKLKQRKEIRQVVRKNNKDYYSIVYAGREAARLRGFEEGTEAFEIEAESRYKRMLYALSHCPVIKSEQIKGSPYVDRKNLELLCDLISKQEAAQIIALPEKEITFMMKDGALPSILGDKANFTRWSAVLDYVGGKETEAKAGIEPAGKYAALLETNKLLSGRLEQTTEELKQAQSKISELKYQVSTYGKGKPAQVKSSEEIGALGEQIANLTEEKQQMTTEYERKEQQMKTSLNELQLETQRQKKAMEKLEKRNQNLQTQLAEAKQYKKTADLRKQRTDTQKYERQVQELRGQLTAAERTILEQQQVLQEQDEMITGWRRKYAVESKEYFAKLVGQADIMEKALSEAQPPKESQIPDLLTYLNQAKSFQPQIIPKESDYSPAMMAQSVTTIPVSDILIWCGKWCESKEQRFIPNLTKYFNALASELQERCEK